MRFSTLEAALQSLPAGIRKELIESFQRIVVNYQEHRWEPSELNGGKLCEIVYCVVQGHLAANYPTRSSKPSNLVKSCQDLESQFPHGPRSFRIQIPRMIIALYEVRNNRGVAHSGGDIDPNHMDATLVLYMSKWLVAELVRALHDLDAAEAAALVEMIMQRQLPLIWEFEGKRRVLNTSLSLRDKTLLLLLSHGEVAESALAGWLEQKNLSNLRSRILRPMHSEKLIEYDVSKRTVTILPPGVSSAESVVRSL